MSEFQFACDKCPRTFKLQEFYDKHKKVHDLKKQHRCHICGFVYGAAKGLEGHIKTHDEEDEKNEVKTHLDCLILHVYKPRVFDKLKTT